MLQKMFCGEFPSKKTVVVWSQDCIGSERSFSFQDGILKAWIYITR